MDLVVLENIIPYQDTYEYKVYKYNDEINMNEKDQFVCDLKVIINRIQPIYESKIEKKIETIALVKNLNIDKSLVEEEIRQLISDEVIEQDLIKEEIEIIFI